MEEAVAGAIVGTAAQAVIEKVVSLISLKLNQVEEFSDDIQTLKSNLIWIKKILDDARMQHNTSKVTKLWVSKVENVTKEAGDALDEFNNHLLREAKRLKSIFSVLFLNDPRKVLGGKIKDINEKFDTLINRETKYIEINQMILGRVDYTPRVGDGLETDSFTLDPVFVGRENDVSEIVVKLANAPTEQVLSILPAVGVAGLGKTALARQVYRDGRLSTRFPTRIWVHVSKTFDPTRIFKKILATLTSEKVEVEGREVVLRKLKGALADKTFLLVLDDVWNQDQRIWDEFINLLSIICSTKKNAIIVTTRKSEVGSIVGTLSVYELQGLSEEGCWSIINANTFGEREISLEFQTIGRNIARRCQGLPLKAKAFGGLLCDKSMADWVSIEQG